MPVPFRIRVTKEILALSKSCGSEDLEIIGENCAIALALKDIFPDVNVTGNCIYPFGIDNDRWNELKIELPKTAQDFIRVFDSLSAIPNQRLRLPEFEFDIAIPDEIISEININEIMAFNYAPSFCI